MPTKNDPKSLLAAAADKFHRAAESQTISGAQRLRYEARRDLDTAVMMLAQGEPYEAPKSPLEVAREEVMNVRAMLHSQAKGLIRSAGVAQLDDALAALDELERGKG